MSRYVTDWLKERGLALSQEKTRIVHLTEGFDFLGFNIRHYPAPQTSRTGWKLLIKPSKESIRKVQEKLRELWAQAQGTNVQAVLRKLNPVIRGWATYFRTVVSKEIFQQLDSWMYHKADSYIKRTHPKKSRDWQHQKYWGRFHLDRLDSWTFGDKQTGGYLLKFNWFPIERHVLVKGTASPDDPCLVDYWKQRQAQSAKDLTLSKQKIANRQQGRCLECFESLFNEEEIQIHHRVPRSLGGNNSYSNLVLVHLLCHQQIHAKAKWAMDECQKDNDREVLTDESSTTHRSKLKEKKKPCCS
jgi:RNA-directed DNA polymerase